MTADNVPVVHHDARLHPDIARNESGVYAGADAPLIRALTYQQLATYDVGRLRPGSAYARRYPGQQAQDGERIPTLAKVLTTCASLDLLVEIKTAPDRPDITHTPSELVEQVSRVLGAAKSSENAGLIAFDWRVLDVAARRAPSLRRGCLTDANTVCQARLWFGDSRLDAHEPEKPGSVPRTVASTGAVIWAPDHKTITEADIAEARRLGLAVIPWTVNDPDDIQRMIELRVDGMISDVPDQAKAMIAARGIALAAPGFVSRLRM
ncbi:putative glycerophosphoryl diester phosphodiesterase precursor [Acidocella aquatica]|uniref:Glycerophosphoryl diester phosphodiesterase n=2 Tax=Acidocella aquatica TaxID=1922313 RepID=A0ABQ6A628_9PROT|nr:putative glycerophosphoryl diester phosphodiesterase precursor [Acidocella aquatica]